MSDEKKRPSLLVEDQNAVETKDDKGDDVIIRTFDRKKTAEQIKERGGALHESDRKLDK